MSTTATTPVSPTTPAPTVGGWRLTLFGLLFTGSILCFCAMATLPDGIWREAATHEGIACWVGALLAAKYLKMPRSKVSL